MSKIHLYWGVCVPSWEIFISARFKISYHLTSRPFSKFHSYHLGIPPVGPLLPKCLNNSAYSLFVGWFGGPLVLWNPILLNYVLLWIRNWKRKAGEYPQICHGFTVVVVSCPCVFFRPCYQRKFSCYTSHIRTFAHSSVTITGARRSGNVVD